LTPTLPRRPSCQSGDVKLRDGILGIAKKFFFLVCLSCELKTKWTQTSEEAIEEWKWPGFY
jgi:hypothetical protein